MLYNQIRMYMLYNHAQKDMLYCITIWNIVRVMLDCDIIPMNKGLWRYSVSIFEDEGRVGSSACSPSPSPRAVRVWRPPVGYPPITTAAQGKVASRPHSRPPAKGNPSDLILYSTKNTNAFMIIYYYGHISLYLHAITIICFYDYILWWLYTCLLIYHPAHISWRLYTSMIICLPDYIALGLYTIAIICSDDYMPSCIYAMTIICHSTYMPLLLYTFLII